MSFCLNWYQPELEPVQEPEPFNFGRVGAGAGAAENRATPQLWINVFKQVAFLRKRQRIARALDHEPQRDNQMNTVHLN